MVAGRKHWPQYSAVAPVKSPLLLDPPRWAGRCPDLAGSESGPGNPHSLRPSDHRVHWPGLACWRMSELVKKERLQSPHGPGLAIPNPPAPAAPTHRPQTHGQAQLRSAEPGGHQQNHPEVLSPQSQATELRAK